MGLPKLLAVGLIAALAAGCTSRAIDVQPPDGTGLATLTNKQQVSVQLMPFAASAAGTADPLNVGPIVMQLNEAWKPIITNLQAGKITEWGNASVVQLAAADKLDVYCQPHNPFDITQAHAIYCVAPAASPGSDVASAPFGTIVLPGEHFKTEVGNAPGDHKQGVSVMMAYFYTLHIRQLLRQAGLISALWGEASKTQWCLTGVSLRALGVVYLPSVAPASLTPESLLPLNLTHVFSGQDVDDLHGKWVLEGFIHGSLNRCFV